MLHKLVHGLRLFWPDPEIALAGKSAICQARYRLGARPVVALFHRVCGPLATAQTPGAFCFGLRLMALDGVVEDVPDSPANVRAFGRRHSDQETSAFPQVQGVYLSECGTHARPPCGRRRERSETVPFHLRPLLLGLKVPHHPGQRRHHSAWPNPRLVIVQPAVVNHATPPQGRDRLSPPPCGRYRPARNPGPLERHAIVQPPGPACKLRDCLLISETRALVAPVGSRPANCSKVSPVRGKPGERCEPEGVRPPRLPGAMFPSASRVADGVSAISELYTARLNPVDALR